MAAVAYFAIAYVVVCNIAVVAFNERGFFGKCWSRSRCTTSYTTNRRDDVTPAERPRTFFAWELHDARHLATSFLPGGAIPPLVYRALALAFCVATFVLVDTEGGGYGDFMPYFTNWTFIGVGLYAVLGVAVSVTHLVRHGNTASLELSGPLDGTTSKSLQATPANGAFGLLDKAFAAVATAVCACSVFLTAFYWAVIYDGGDIDVSNPLRHGGAAAVMLGEFLVARTPVAGQWFSFALAYASVYAIFMWVYWAVEDRWTYEALDWRDTDNAVYYAVLPPLVYAGFAITYLAAAAREFFARGESCCRCCCCAPRASATQPDGIELTTGRVRRSTGQFDSGAPGTGSVAVVVA